MFVNNIHEVVITDADIRYAEDILLQDEQTFDEERVTFIKDLTTLDLQAVPGSGKTTALLAKLLILERYLPFNDGSGILVISHTNTAVDEIKDKIGTYCPKLFSYPNFIGTIQSFINKFLAIPFYENRIKKKIVVIDDKIYESNFQNFSYENFTGFVREEQTNAKRFLRVDKNQKYRFGYDENNQRILLINFNGDKLGIKKPQGNTRIENYTDWNDNEKYKVYKWLEKYKYKLMESGILHYDDIYFLANANIIKNPYTIQLLQQRFCAVFVDEMQDMGQHQYELIEKVFNTEGSLSTIQRIGDKNQAIYAGFIETDEVWVNRENKLSINGTHRLSKPIVEVVKYFGIDYIDINNTSNHAEDIKPHVLIYNDTNIGDVIPKFSKIIKDLLESGKIPSKLKNPFKAIAWRKEHESHIALTSYFDFEVNHHIIKENYKNLKSYLLFFENENREFKYIRKNIIQSLLRVLQLEDIKDDNDRFYTSYKLLKYLKEETDQYDDFNLKLYSWCHTILIVNDIDSVYMAIKSYSENLLGLFDKVVSKSSSFLSDTGTTYETQTTTMNQNIYNEDGFDIGITTVHSAKGETHTATLYLETFYERNCLGGSYESQRLSPHFNDITLDSRRETDSLTSFSEKILLQSMKMIYVGFSRPTHLLCFAVHEDRVGDLIGLENWEKVCIDAS